MCFILIQSVLFLDLLAAVSTPHGAAGMIREIRESVGKLRDRTRPTKCAGLKSKWPMLTNMNLIHFAGLIEVENQHISLKGSGRKDVYECVVLSPTQFTSKATILSFRDDQGVYAWARKTL